MLKKLINECIFDLEIILKSPLLIKDGRYDEKTKKEWFVNDAIGKPDAILISRNTPKEIKKAIQVDDVSKLDFYIPGSSLRGIMRSHAEKIVRTICPENTCCNPLEKDTKCKNKNYKDSCIICKLFGSTGTAGRIHIHDSDKIVVTTDNVIERTGNAIDRFTGGVSESDGHGALFKNTMLEGSIFKTQITIHNFEIWQLGLLAYILRDFNVFSEKDESGLITIGSGKNRGLGRVKGKINEVYVIYYDKDITKTKYELMGIAEICPTLDYGFIKSDQLPQEKLLDDAIIDDNTPYIKRCKVKEPLFGFFKECAQIWDNAVKANFKTIN